MDPPLFEQLLAQELQSLEQLLEGIRSRWPDRTSACPPRPAPAVIEAPAEARDTTEPGSPKRQRPRCSAEPLCTLTSQQLRERSQQTLGARQELARSICALVSEDGDGRIALRSHPGRCVRDVVRYRSGGAEIPSELQRRLLHELCSLPWPKKRHRAKAVVAERYLVIWRDPGPRAGHERLFGLLQELAAPCGDPWTHVAVTKNFQGSPHRDEQDATWQRVISLGDFVGGELCVEGPLEGRDAPLRRLYVVSTRNRLTRVDGRFPHFVRQREGDRFSLVYYCLDAREFREPVQPLELSDDAAAEPE